MNGNIEMITPHLSVAYHYLKTSLIEGCSWLGYKIVWLVDKTGLPNTQLWHKITPTILEVWAGMRPYMVSLANFLKTGNGVGIFLILFSSYHIYHALGRGYPPRIDPSDEPPVDFTEIRRPMSRPIRIVFTITHLSLLVLAGVALTHGTEVIL